MKNTTNANAGSLTRLVRRWTLASILWPTFLVLDYSVAVLLERPAAPMRAASRLAISKLVAPNDQSSPTAARR